MPQSKNLFSSAANCALSSTAFTIFSVLERFDQSNLLPIQLPHWQISKVCITLLMPSRGNIMFAPDFQTFLRPKLLSFLHIRLQTTYANRHIYLLASDHTYNSFSPHLSILLSKHLDLFLLRWLGVIGSFADQRMFIFSKVEIDGEYQVTAFPEWPLVIVILDALVDFT